MDSYKQRMKVIGMEIKIARIRKHMTQEQLAKILGTTKTSISDWERGNKIPNFFVMNELKKILGEEFQKLAQI